MEDEILEFNYRSPNRRFNRHPNGCLCIRCIPSRPKVRLGVSSRGVGEGKKAKINVPPTFNNSSQMVHKIVQWSPIPPKLKKRMK
jgi:hypothetical protein